MVKSLYSGVSGLKTHQAKMDVIGNNIANVNTTGFKAGVVTFRDIYYQYKINPSAGTATSGGVNPAMVGYGVRLNSTTANMTQSGFTQSDWWADVALDGEGFFQVMDSTGNIYYTRAGRFDVDADGYLINASGNYVLGVTGDPQGVEPSSQRIRIVIPDTEDNCSSATQRVNGVDVTLSVSAPSDNTNISVTFTEAEFPYATFNNGILNIFFNPDDQYGSQDDFEAAIATALQAGGVQLPDDVELKFEFSSIPDDYPARAASNIVEDFKVSTKTAEYQFHQTYEEAGITKHAYMTFAVPDPTCKDKVQITIDEAADGADTDVEAKYEKGVWSLTIYGDSTAADINEAIKKEIDRIEAAGGTVSKLNCENMVLPSGDTMREEMLQKLVYGVDAETGEANEPDPDAPSQVELVGGTKTGVTLDVEVQEAGEFGNNYKVVFSYKAGYGKTSAVWDEGTLNVTICADSTIGDVNQAIKEAANGDQKKMLKFNEISGLDYGPKYDFDRKIEAGEDGKYTITETDRNGNQRIAEDVENIDDLSNIEWTKYITADGTEQEADEVADDIPFEDTKDPEDIWQSVFRESFFGGNPAIKPTNGKDSFFTETAKSLETFNLENGRIGRPQSYGDLLDIVVQTDGTIVGLHAVHGYITFGRIDIATFDNVNGLAQVGGTNFKETVASGGPKLKTAGTDGAGAILSGSLEMSNVDLSQEFTDMITTQRGFQANSRVITVSDTMLEELLSLKR